FAVSFLYRVSFFISILSSMRSSLSCSLIVSYSSFFFNDTATTELYTLSLHDALPIYAHPQPRCSFVGDHHHFCGNIFICGADTRSEEHTSELQSRENLVCRLLLEKKNKQIRCMLLGSMCSD